MSSAIQLNFQGFEALENALENVSRVAPEIVQKELNNAGTKFIRDVKKETNRVTTKRTGNLVNGYKKKKVAYVTVSGFKGWGVEITGGNRKARHYHLVENGHKRYEKVFPCVQAKGIFMFCKSTAGFTSGKNMMKNTVDAWIRNDTIVNYAERAIKQAIDKGFNVI